MGSDGTTPRIGPAGKLALLLHGVFVSLGTMAIGPALPRIQADFADDANAAMLIQAIGVIVIAVFAFASPVAGRVVGRYGARSVYLVSVLICVVGGVGPALCTSLPQMIPFRILLGLGAAGAFTAGVAEIARLPESQRHFMFGLSSVAGSAVAIPSLILVGFLAEQGWRLAFAIFFIFLLALPLVLALPRHEREAVTAHKEGLSRSAGILADVPLVLLVAATIVGWSSTSVSIYSPFLLGTVGMKDSANVGLVMSGVHGVSLTVSAAYGFIQRVTGTQKILFSSIVFVIAGACIVAISGSPAVAIAGLAIMVAGIGAFTPAAFATASDAAGPHGNAGAAMGMLAFAMTAPQLAFPLLTGLVGGSFGPYAVYVALAVLASMLLLFVRPKGPLRRRLNAS